VKYAISTLLLLVLTSFSLHAAEPSIDGNARAQLLAWFNSNAVRVDLNQLTLAKYSWIKRRTGMSMKQFDALTPAQADPMTLQFKNLLLDDVARDLATKGEHVKDLGEDQLRDRFGEAFQRIKAATN
jgi:hypothetical protein